MQSTIFKQKSNYWRVFALCFFTAVLLFAPHCIVDAAQALQQHLPHQRHG